MSGYCICADPENCTQPVRGCRRKIAEMTDDKDALLRELDDFEECARLLGRTDARKEFGCYTEQDSRFEVAMRQSISKHRARITAALDGGKDGGCNHDHQVIGMTGNTIHSRTCQRCGESLPLKGDCHD